MHGEIPLWVLTDDGTFRAHHEEKRPSHHASGCLPAERTALLYTGDCHLFPALSIRRSISPWCPRGATATPAEIGIP